MIFYTYFKTAFMPAGKVPHDWQPDNRVYYPLPERKRKHAANAQNSGADPLQAPDPRAPRFCDPCNQYKPPRTHHCKYCNKCTVKMDHHCPWVNNCVGHNNHKMFILFLFYAVFGLAYVVIFSIIRAYQLLMLVGKGNKQQPGDLVIVILIAVMAFSVMMGILMLLIFQLENVLKNVTTIERDSCEPFKRKARREKKKFFYPYQMKSESSNWAAVFGENKGDWLKPIEGTSHDGTYWDIREEFLELASFESV
jgi:palmitoyltransferase